MSRAVLPWPRGSVRPTSSGPLAGLIPRPERVSDVVRLLTGKARGGMVGVAAGRTGDGGFGQTTLARMVCADRRVLREYFGGPVVLEIGPDLRGPALAGAICEVISGLKGEWVSYTSPEEAGRTLCRLLDDRPASLLVLDGICHAEQLSPFQYGRGSWQILATSHDPRLLPGAAIVNVDRLTDGQAGALLRRGTGKLSRRLVDDLVRACGGWALLLDNVNGQLRTAYGQEANRLARAGAEALARLRSVGPAALDITRPDQRRAAIKATIDGGLDLAPALNRDRIYELGIFPDGKPIPLDVVADLWSVTGGLSAEQSRWFVEQAAARSLLRSRRGSGTLRLHDVVRRYLRYALGPDGVRKASSALLNHLAAGVGSDPSRRVAWWRLPPERLYLWQYLTDLLFEAGRADARADLAVDPRWIMAKLPLLGPAALAADLSGVDNERAATLRSVLGQSAHLLAPTEPVHAVADILLNRLAAQPVWSHPVAATTTERPLPWLGPFWPMLDAPNPSLRQALSGHTGRVSAVAIAPNGTWIASTGDEGSVRIWDAQRYSQRASFPGHNGPIRSVAIAPDGRWLATGGSDRTIRVWDITDPDRQAILTGHIGPVSSVAISPDGAWIASASDDGTVRIWESDTATHTFTDHRGPVRAVAISPDGGWLASAGDDATVRVWDVANGASRGTLTGHVGSVRSVVIAPDGSWLASAGDDGAVRIWNAHGASPRASLTGHTGPVTSLAISRDSRWLASAGDDNTVRIWDAHNGIERTVLTGGTRSVAMSPDGTWLASASNDRTVRLWNSTTPSAAGSTLSAHTDSVTAVAIAPDGTWLASASNDQTARIWDYAAATPLAALAGHAANLRGVAISPDSSWLATCANDPVVRLWDMATASTRAALSGHLGGVASVAIAPDGGWLASAGDDSTVRLWDAHAAIPRTTLTGHTGPVRSVAIAADGSWLASGGGDGTVRIWDAQRSVVRATLAGHTDGVFSVAISPDGFWLASASADRTVRLWDASRGAPRAILTGHSAVVRGVDIAPDGGWLVSVSDDRTVRIWAPDGRILTMIRLDAQPTSVAVDRAARIAVGTNLGVFVFQLNLRRPSGAATAPHQHQPPHLPSPHLPSPHRSGPPGPPHPPSGPPHPPPGPPYQPPPYRPGPPELDQTETITAIN